jgi:hypothetical protein
LWSPSPARALRQQDSRRTNNSSALSQPCGGSLNKNGENNGFGYCFQERWVLGFSWLLQTWVLQLRLRDGGTFAQNNSNIVIKQNKIEYLKQPGFVILVHTSVVSSELLELIPKSWEGFWLRLERKGKMKKKVKGRNRGKRGQHVKQEARDRSHIRH